MATLVSTAVIVPAVGTKPKVIEEFIGNVSTPQVDGRLSIARMRSPTGWVEPGQTPAFDEYTLVLAGLLRVESRSPHGRISRVDVHAGQAVIAKKGEWVRYSTPGPVGAEYVAVCLPAFSPGSVHRDSG